MANIGKIDEFNTHDDIVIYQEKLEQYFTANKITEPKIKVATLLSLVGTNTYKLLRDLCFPEKPAEKTYEHLTQLLVKQYSPQVSIFRERIKFHKSRQNNDENSSAWYARIRSLAVNCNFGDKLEIFLKNQFICGMTKSDILDRICEESENKSLEDLLKLAVQKESLKIVSTHEHNLNFARRYNNNGRQTSNSTGYQTNRTHLTTNTFGNAAQMHQRGRTTTSDTRQGKKELNSNNKKPLQSKQTCRVCGLTNHDFSHCKYKNYRCRKCKNVGHLESVCIKKFKGHNYLNNDNFDVNNESFEIFNINTHVNNSNPFKLNVFMCNKEYSMIVDTGASINGMNYEFYQQNFGRFKLVKDNIILKGYTGENIQPIGYFMIKVGLNNIFKYIKFYVVRNGGPSVLFHRIDGVDKPIACTSRTYMPNEEAYAIIDKEALALVFGLKKFQQYCQGVDIIIRVDHQPLVSIFGEKKGIPQRNRDRLQRYAIFIKGFSYKIEYIKSKHNTVADAFSRLPVKVNTISNEYTRNDYLNFAETCLEWPLDCKKIAQETLKDPILKIVFENIEKGWKKTNNDELRPYYNKRDELHIENSCILWGFRVIIPKCLQNIILEELHVSHQGICRTKSLARSYVWFPKIDEKIEHMIKSCVPCLKNHSDPIKNIITPWPIARRPMERVHIDILGPIKNQMFLILTDSYSKWLEIFILKNLSSQEIEKHLRATFARFSIPDFVISDNGRQLISQEILDFYKRNGIKHITSPVNHPASNGAAEICVKVVKNKLKAALEDPKNEKVSLDTLISRFLISFRNTEHTVTKMTPAELMIGRKLKTRLDLLRKPSVNEENEDYAVENMEKRREKVITESKGGKRSFEIKEEVMARDYRKVNKKLWIEAKIEKKLGKSVYLCRTRDNLLWKRHVDQIARRRKEEKREDITEKQDFKTREEKHVKRRQENFKQFLKIPNFVSNSIKISQNSLEKHRNKKNSEIDAIINQNVLVTDQNNLINEDIRNIDREDHNNDLLDIDNINNSDIILNKNLNDNLEQTSVVNIINNKPNILKVLDKPKNKIIDSGQIPSTSKNVQIPNVNTKNTSKTDLIKTRSGREIKMPNKLKDCLL
ncbi:unnamed protein product [Brassicogethes aeneus]|uniref:RNA-directed DNA polymerase n=1 Tax=Brassicogethes aeneus TaxID=1431903 RepID=A0A9P0BDG0_BRAAE|nr:unnamed protein product [Brassicogethes aeneus]